MVPWYLNISPREAAGVIPTPKTILSRNISNAATQRSLRPVSPLSIVLNILSLKTSFVAKIYCTRKMENTKPAIIKNIFLPVLILLKRVRIAIPTNKNNNAPLDPDKTIKLILLTKLNPIKIILNIESPPLYKIPKVIIKAINPFVPTIFGFSPKISNLSCSKLIPYPNNVIKYNKKTAVK